MGYLQPRLQRGLLVLKITLPTPIGVALAAIDVEKISSLLENNIINHFYLRNSYYQNFNWLFSIGALLGLAHCKAFQVTTEVKPGCVLSPFLFLLCIYWILKETTKTGKWGLRWTEVFGRSVICWIYCFAFKQICRHSGQNRCRVLKSWCQYWQIKNYCKSNLVLYKENISYVEECKY